MDEFNESENSQPIEGQICYDELEPIVEEKEEKFEANLDGQIGFDDFLNSKQEIEKCFKEFLYQLKLLYLNLRLAKNFYL